MKETKYELLGQYAADACLELCEIANRFNIDLFITKDIEDCPIRTKTKNKDLYQGFNFLLCEKGTDLNQVWSLYRNGGNPQ